MGYRHFLRQKSGTFAGTSRSSSWRLLTAAFLIAFGAVSAYAFQGDQSSPEQHSSPDFEKYAPLVNEVGLLLQKIQAGVQVPAPRTQSRILPLLPASTNVYFSLPNYGDALHQADEIFHQQLQERPALNDYWQQVGMAGFMIEGVIDKVHQFGQYIGNEIVISSSISQQGPSVLVLAEIKKPGLKTFLQDLLSQFGGANPPVQILTPQDLITAKAEKSGNQSFVLVRPDFVIFGTDLGSIRKFNTQLVGHSGTFATTPFGQRLNQAYRAGAGILVGADVQQLLALRPKGSDQDEAAFKRTGFADAKFLIADYKSDAGQSVSDGELSFNGPRQGIAAWLAPPAPIGGLDFVSSSASSAGSVVLKNPAQIFDELKDIASSANPMAEIGLQQLESELKINLRDDLFSKLGGEFSAAVDGPISPVPAFKILIKVSDPVGLQQTIARFVAAGNAKAEKGKEITLDEKAESGLTYHTLGFGEGAKRQNVVYTFADGYLVAGASRELVANAIQIHRNGNSLAKSSEYRTSMPQGHPECSAVGYQNPAKIVAGDTQPSSPEQEEFMREFMMLRALVFSNKTVTSCVYAEPTAIRLTSNSGVVLAALVALPAAAIAIPNLMHSKGEARESQAASTIRSFNMVEVSYSTDHPTMGYASDFKSLGADSPLNCPAEGPCIQGGFQYSLTGVCEKNNCQDYVITATPVGGSEKKSFCSTSDFVVRSHPGPVSPEQVSVEECQKWSPL
jgi:hypothetical protein